MGDYGTGKTTLLSRLRYLHLKHLADGKPAPLPVIFLLKNFYKFDKLDDFVTHSFHENYHSAVDPSWFWAEAAKGNFVLLLDGFDEISIKSNNQVRQMLLARIAPLLYTKSPTVISCRPSYFVNSVEFEKLVKQHNIALAGAGNSPTRSSRNALVSINEKASDLRARIVHRYVECQDAARRPEHPISKIELLEFDTSQIKSYLSRFDNQFAQVTRSGTEQIYAFVTRIYDLTDLMKRPILLEMIVDTGALDVRNSDQSIGAATLYEIYTEGKPTMEASKGLTRHLLSSPERRDFAQIVAYAMYKEGTLDIKFPRIVGLVKEYGHIAERIRASFNDEDAFEFVANDVKSCGFLQREKDTFQFSHRSFMEFFLARKIFLDVRREGT